ncbi:MAG: hypothetical protein HZA08_08500 [Nitrospirae bacterium]|nr:hypothetical protein [Nitrospirota bacterium]
MNSHEPGFTKGHESQRDRNVPPILMEMDRRGFLTAPEVFSDEVKDTILDPEKTADSIKGRKNVFKHVGEKWLKVTYKEENDKITVVTVVDKNK